MIWLNLNNQVWTVTSHRFIMHKMINRTAPVLTNVIVRLNLRLAGFCSCTSIQSHYPISSLLSVPPIGKNLWNKVRKRSFVMCPQGHSCLNSRYSSLTSLAENLLSAWRFSRTNCVLDRTNGRRLLITTTGGGGFLLLLAGSWISSCSSFTVLRASVAGLPSLLSTKKYAEPILRK